MGYLVYILLGFCAAVKTSNTPTTEQDRQNDNVYPSDHGNPEDNDYNPFWDLITPEHAAYSKDPDSVEELYCSEVIKYFEGYYCAQEGYFGRGGNGITFIVNDGSESEFILKVQEDKKQRGIQALIDVQGHESIIKLQKAMILGNHMVYITEFAHFGNLQTYRNRFYYLFRNDTFVLELFEDIVKGVQHIHSKDIVHADIKIYNIVVGKNHKPKIIDFDLCVRSSESKKGRGTGSYMAPEVHASWPNSEYMAYNTKVDVYSLGVTLYYLFFESYPFNALELQAIFEMLNKHSFLIKAGTRIDLAKIFERSLRWDQNERADTNEFMSRIEKALHAAAPAKTLLYDESLANTGRNVFLEKLDPLDVLADERRIILCALIGAAATLCLLWIWQQQQKRLRRIAKRFILNTFDKDLKTF